VDEFFLENLPTDVFRRRRSQLFRNPVGQQDRTEALKSIKTDWEKAYGTVRKRPSKYTPRLDVNDIKSDSDSDSENRSKQSDPSDSLESRPEEENQRIETSKGNAKAKIGTNDLSM
jgi:hypothetical protein